jgi:hypothetical protein
MHQTDLTKPTTIRLRGVEIGEQDSLGERKGFNITILQWNIDGISFPGAQDELYRSLEKHKIDIKYHPRNSSEPQKDYPLSRIQY